MAPRIDPMRVEAAARVATTPSGDGEMVWRIWGSGPALVLLHGAHGSWTHWIRNVETLASGATVVVPDLPGLGDSAVPADPGDGPSYVRTLSDGLRSLLGRREPYDLVGFSFGATIGARLASLDGHRVRSLVLLSVGGFGDRARLQLESVRRITDEAERNGAHRRNLEIMMVADPATIDDAAVAIQRANVERARIEPRDVAWPTSTQAAITEVASRVGAIYGDRDATIAPSAERRREQLLAFRPDADVRIIQNAGHWVQFERPAQADTIIGELIAKG